MSSMPNAIDPAGINAAIDANAQPSGPINWAAILEEILDAQPINMEDDQLPEELAALNCLEGEDYIRVVLPMKSRSSMMGFMSNNNFEVVNEDSKLLLRVSESDSMIKKLCSGPARDIHLKFFDLNNKLPIFEFLKRGRCDGLLCGFCLHYGIAESKMGSQVAEMRQIFSVNKDKYAIWDGSFNDKPFAILNANKFLMHRCNTENKIWIEGGETGEDLGAISKCWGPRLGGEKRVNMDHEVFFLQVDADLSVRKKAALLVAGFLMYYVYMEIS